MRSRSATRRVTAPIPVSGASRSDGWFMNVSWSAEVEGVAGVVALRLEVSRVGLGEVDARGDALGDGHAERVELPGLVGVVAQQSDAVHAHRTEHLRGGAVVALVLAAAQGAVRLVRVRSEEHTSELQSRQ